MAEDRDRVILHCDLNSYYASVEMLLRPDLSGKAIAVCGKVSERHGIVLARSEAAKKRGVRAGEAVWQARQKCPGLIIVNPHYEKYVEYARRVKDIYSRYTDQVESFGIDEAWLDVSGSRTLFGDGKEMADDIRKRVKAETGLTVSIGVSFNKIFSKLGSDLDKPDATTVITRENYKDKLRDLPVSIMLGIGRSAGKKLSGYGIHTIGELAAAKPELLELLFGRNGRAMWGYANGIDNSPVMQTTQYLPIKSIGHGNTALSDLVTNEEVRLMLLELSQDVSRRLRENHFRARRIQIGVKDNGLDNREYQCVLDYPTQSSLMLADAGYALFLSNYRWHKPIRAMNVRAIGLEPGGMPFQSSIFTSDALINEERRTSLDTTVDGLRKKYGRYVLDLAALLDKSKIPADSDFDFNSMPS